MIKDEFLQNLVQLNCIPVLIIIFLVFFLKINYRYEKALTKLFIPSIVLLLALIITDNIDYYAADATVDAAIYTSGLDVLHRVAAMLGYDLRITLMASLISIAAKRVIGHKSTVLFTYLPALVNIVLLLPCLFTDLFFYYYPDGTIGRGPLAYEPHILSVFYMLFLFVLAHLCRKKGKQSEMEILALCGLLTILGFLAEFLFSLRGILIGVVALEITFYYLYLHIEHFRFDALTGVFNRDAFNADVDKFGSSEISHIMSIDLNNLKQLNDIFGHEEGDKALKAIAKALENACPDKCCVYRVGGDEFAALCRHKTDAEVEAIVAAMYSHVDEAGYSCAVGYAEWGDGKTFTEVYKVADDMMYKKKRTMKEIISEPMRIK
ncbi:MAG: GGDEF domain-containing protein [Ruminiclostridium sp.]|nr:GGDEF domain-containing protein [Ruminiclostridium sp.]